MASPGHEYTLVGFSEEVDRRPLIFVEPLPSAKVCSACGLVPKAIALHECEHYFCKPCYEQCRRRGDVVCPLDGEACLEDEITWINYKTRTVMTKKVLCWNHRNGCNVVTAAAHISRHFHHECGHHSSRCPKCSAEILASDVCTHLESRCDASTEPGAAAAQSGTVPQEQESLGATTSEIADGFRQIHNTKSTAMSSIQAELKEISRTLKIGVRAATSCQQEEDEGSERRLLQESLNQMRIQTAKLKDQLDEFMQNVYANQQTFHNSFVEKNEAFKKSVTDAVPSRIDYCQLVTQLVAFREAVGDGQRETKSEFDRLSLAIDRQYDRMSGLLRSTDANQETRTRNSREAAEAHTDSVAENASKIAWAKNSSPEDRRNALALLTSIMPVATTHTWTIERCESLKQRARSESFVRRMEEPVYLRGYCVSVGVTVYSPSVTYFLFDLHKGEVDRHLEWPFNLQIRLSILHPVGDERLEYCVTPSRTFLYKDAFLRRKERSRSDGCVTVCTVLFSTDNLEFRGFVKDGRVLLRLSLEDPSADDEP